MYSNVVTIASVRTNDPDEVTGALSVVAHDLHHLHVTTVGGSCDIKANAVTLAAVTVHTGNGQHDCVPDLNHTVF